MELDNGDSMISAGYGHGHASATDCRQTINLGGDDTGRLGLTDAELDRVTAGTQVIGDANSGAVNVSAGITQAGKITNIAATTTTTVLDARFAWHHGHGEPAAHGE